MKWIVLLATPLLMGACNTLHSPSNGDAGGNEGGSRNSTSVMADSLDKFFEQEKANAGEPEEITINQILGDSVCKIVETASSLNVYLMKQTIITDDSTVMAIDSIAGCPYVRKDSIDSASMREILKFIILDKSLYYRDNAQVKQPYSPYLTAEFVSGNGNAIFQFSFGTEEIGIMQSDSKLMKYQVSNWHQIARWCSKCIPDDEYIQNFK